MSAQVDVEVAAADGSGFEPETSVCRSWDTPEGEREALSDARLAGLRVGGAETETERFERGKRTAAPEATAVAEANATGQTATGASGEEQVNRAVVLGYVPEDGFGREEGEEPDAAAEASREAALHRVNVPTKIGGSPAWLAPPCPQLTDALLCSGCNIQLVFLGQIYAPRSAPHDFHRMLYFFVCQHCKVGARCYRLSLPMENAWLPSERSEDSEILAPAQKAADAAVCSGCCTSCLLPLASATPKKKTAPTSTAPTSTSPRSTPLTVHASAMTKEEEESMCLRCRNTKKYGRGNERRSGQGNELGKFREFPIEIESEAEAAKAWANDGDESGGDLLEAQLLAEAYEQQMKVQEVTAEAEAKEGGGEEGEEGEEDEDGEEEEEEGEEGRDAAMEKYIEFMSRHPPHVLRYGAQAPLWFSDKDRPSKKERKDWVCGHCKGPVEFEAQIQSSILDILGAAGNVEVGFGILALFSCRKSCPPRVAGQFLEEIIVRQPDNTLESNFRK